MERGFLFGFHLSYGSRFSYTVLTERETMIYRTELPRGWTGEG